MLSVKNLLSSIKRLLPGSTRLVEFPDYETYRRIQNEGNRQKLHLVYAQEANIKHLAQYIERRRGGPVSFVLCHGTRNGAEIAWFKANLSGRPRLLGTDIADTASQFPDTIQWDFHDLKDEWVGACDAIYSNSWDHAFDPRRMLKNWIACLKPDGVILLEHSDNHLATKTSDLDPFGTTVAGLTAMIEEIGEGKWRVVDVIRDLPSRQKGQCVVVVGAAR